METMCLGDLESEIQIQSTGGNRRNMLNASLFVQVQITLTHYWQPSTIHQKPHTRSLKSAVGEFYQHVVSQPQQVTSHVSKPTSFVLTVGISLHYLKCSWMTLVWKQIGAVLSSVDTTSKTLEFKAGLVTCAGIGSGGKRIVYKLLLQN